MTEEQRLEALAKAIFRRVNLLEEDAVVRLWDSGVEHGVGRASCRAATHEALSYLGFSGVPAPGAVTELVARIAELEREVARVGALYDEQMLRECEACGGRDGHAPHCPIAHDRIAELEAEIARLREGYKGPPPL